MAKSLRSKAKQQNKVIKRQTVFGEAAAAREERIAERLHNAAIDQILAKQDHMDEEKPKVPKVKKVERVKGKKVQGGRRKKSKLQMARK